jgi:hypothetical protein
MTASGHGVQGTHAVHSWVNFIFSVIIAALVFVSVVLNLLAAPNEIVKEVGVQTFRMFMVLTYLCSVYLEEYLR